MGLCRAREAHPPPRCRAGFPPPASRLALPGACEKRSLSLQGRDCFWSSAGEKVSHREEKCLFQRRRVNMSVGSLGSLPLRPCVTSKSHRLRTGLPLQASLPVQPCTAQLESRVTATHSGRLGSGTFKMRTDFQLAGC